MQRTAHGHRFPSSCPPAALLMDCMRNTASISLLVLCSVQLHTGMMAHWPLVMACTRMTGCSYSS